MAKHARVVNPDDLEWQTKHQGTRFQGLRKALGRAAGSQKLGCSLFRLPPGNSGFPFHAHFANEEAVYVLEGTGSARIGADTVPIGPGDYIAHLTGHEHPHQITNTGSEDLVYLCFSTMIDPEVVTYPDSNKIGMMAGAPPGGPQEERVIWSLYHPEDSLDYLDGENP